MKITDDIDERSAFEKWWQSCGKLHPSRCTEPGYTDEYDNPIAQSAWKAWQARTALALETEANKKKGRK